MSAATWAVPVAALAISLATFVMSLIGMRRRARVDYVDQLEKRISECDRDRARLHDEVRNLREVNLQAMVRIFELEKGAKG